MRLLSTIISLTTTSISRYAGGGGCFGSRRLAYHAVTTALRAASTTAAMRTVDVAIVGSGTFGLV